MPTIETVAVHAILLREAARNHHSGFESHLDDIDSCRDELSFATLVAAQAFTDLDWWLAETLWKASDQTVLAVVGTLRMAGEPLRAEAFIHAHCEAAPERDAAEPYLARWEDVRCAIRGYEAQGFALKFGKVDHAADMAYRAATGASFEELLDRFYNDDSVLAYPE